MAQPFSSLNIRNKMYVILKILFLYLQQLPISHIFIVLGRWREEHSFPADSLVLDHTQSSDLVLKPFVSHSPIHCVRKYDVLKEKAFYFKNQTQEGQK